MTRVFSSILFTEVQVTVGIVIHNNTGNHPVDDFFRISFQIETMIIPVIKIVRRE
jgi:desulfoferrodoxin (superoxide reductase-like protein)